MTTTTTETKRYPVKARVRVLNTPRWCLPLKHGEHTIERLGGGEMLLPYHGYYPTVLWVFPTVKGGTAYIRPTDDFVELLEIIEWHESRDPMGATESWPLAPYRFDR